MQYVEKAPILFFFCSFAFLVLDQFHFFVAAEEEGDKVLFSLRVKICVFFFCETYQDYSLNNTAVT